MRAGIVAASLFALPALAGDQCYTWCPGNPWPSNSFGLPYPGKPTTEHTSTVKPTSSGAVTSSSKLTSSGAVSSSSKLSASSSKPTSTATGKTGLPTASAQFNYTTVAGYFLQDVNTTNATSFDYTAVNLGLINQTYDTDGHGGPANLTQWQRFDRKLSELNRQAASGTEYKLLILGRHGEGWHNAAESYYGTPAWNCYYSLIDGNSTATWADARLTPNGVAQAQTANNFWKYLLNVQKIHAPDAYFTSPLSRCLSTANITFSGLTLPRRKPFVPTIKEFLREGISIHTCDRRSNKTYIHDNFPTWPFEAGFAEQDPYWNGVTAETSSAQDWRSKAALDSIFSATEGSYISITSHSGEIGSILRVLGHRTFSLNTGAVIPVLVKAVTQAQPGPTTSSAWSASAHCTVPPLSSGSAGCVCPSSAAPVTTTLPGSGPTYVVLPSDSYLKR